MALPASFAKSGFTPMSQGRVKVKLPNGKLLKPLLIGTEGESNTGKTEFLLSCPGPGIIICVDRGIDGVLDNPKPPASRHSDWAVKVISVPPSASATQPVFAEYFTAIRSEFYSALAIPEALTVCIDGDSDFWELHRLAAFGKLVGVMPMRYSSVYAERKALTAKAWDSGKIVVGTNKLKDEYGVVYKPNGEPEKDIDGTDKRKKTGQKERQGFPDQDYLWQIQIRHIYKPPTAIEKGPLAGKMKPAQWGIKILKCKSQPELAGEELWGSSCNFKGLVNLVYPQIPDEDWGL